MKGKSKSKSKGQMSEPFSGKPRVATYAKHEGKAYKFIPSKTVRMVKIGPTQEYLSERVELGIDFPDDRLVKKLIEKFRKMFVEHNQYSLLHHLKRPDPLQLKEAPLRHVVGPG
jgi:hypothetical protein